MFLCVRLYPGCELLGREAHMTFTYGLIWGSWVLFGITTVWGLMWAIRTHQFKGFESGARVIFDDDEPVGEMTDHFPGEKPGGEEDA